MKFKILQRPLIRCLRHTLILALIRLVLYSEYALFIKKYPALLNFASSRQTTYCKYMVRRDKEGSTKTVHVNIMAQGSGVFVL